MFGLKLKAGALQLTTFIIVVIALLLTTFILLVHTHRQFKIQSNFIIETTKLSGKGVDYTFQNEIPLKDTVSISLNDEDYKSLKVHRDFWGLFEKITSIARIKTKTFKTVALIGSKQPKDNRIALYVQDNNKPLVLVGTTKIEGSAYVPKQGVKPGHIAGQSYYGSQLIYGATRVASSLPKLQNEIVNSLAQLKTISSSVSQNQFLNIQDGETYSNSFLQPLQVVYSNGVIDLRNIQLTGHILVQSKTKIVIHPSSKLKDIILVAPEIEIKANTIGNFQAIASKKIMVEKNAKLKYPSALILNEELNTTEQNNPISVEDKHNITLEENASVKGVVMFLGREKPNNYKPQIELRANATIYGELYNTQNTELLGAVYGSVFANNFIAKQSGSVYQNHIYNGTIRIDELPQEYIGLLFNNSKKDVLKWLY